MIEALELFNWGPFRGRHVVAFRPGATAVVAYDVAEPGRSNAVGKSMVLEAIQYALTGELNPSREYDVDGWITSGEKEGHVSLALEGGASIWRGKKRGQSRQVRSSIRRDGGLVVANQAAAEKSVEKWLAFSSDDYKRVAYFEQKEASRLLNPERTDPATRLSIVSGWLGLSVADRAEEVASALMSELWREVERAGEQKRMLDAYVRAPADTPTFEADKQAEIDRIKKAVDDLQAKVDSAREAQHAQQIVERYQKIVEEGKKLREWVDENGDGIDEHHERASEDIKVKFAALNAVSDEVGKRRKVSLGLFDGQCPVASIQCPATDQINGDREAAKAALAAVQERHAKFDRDNARAAKTYAEWRERKQDLDKARARLASLRADAEEIFQDYKAAKKKAAELLEQDELVEAIGELTRARQALSRAEVELHTHKRVLEIYAKDLEQQERAGAELLASTEQHRVAHKTREVFRLARRRVAERALSAIEEDANDALASVGVDLQIGVRWEREGKKPAIECAECGAPYPSTRTVKECPRCAAPRGMHHTPRLDFTRTASSGGYDDLAGIALQLSAGAWLLRARSSPWSTAVLDEPTAAMDPVVRRGLVSYLAGVASSGRYRQLLVVSHSSDFVDAIPNRVTIVRRRDGSRAITQG